MSWSSLDETRNPDHLHRQSGFTYLYTKCYPTIIETPPSLVVYNNKRKLW